MVAPTWGDLDANELKFAADGSLTITISHKQPADVDARAMDVGHSMGPIFNPWIAGAP